MATPTIDENPLLYKQSDGKYILLEASLYAATFKIGFKTSFDVTKIVLKSDIYLIVVSEDGTAGSDLIDLNTAPMFISDVPSKHELRIGPDAVWDYVLPEVVDAEDDPVTVTIELASASAFVTTE